MRVMVCSSWRVGLACLLVLIAVLAGATPRPVRAASLAVRSLYAARTTAQAPTNTSPDTFDLWCQSDTTCKPPPKVTAYPTGQIFVDLYFTTNYQTQNALDLQSQMHRFSLVIRGRLGVFVRCAISGLDIMCNNNQAKGGFRVYESNGMFQVWAPQQPQDNQSSAYPDDTYRADLLIDGHLAARTTFTVGAPSLPTPTRSAITAFYTIPESIYNACAHRNFVRPYRVSMFKVGTQMVFFYVAWRGISPSMSIIVAIRNAQNLPEVQLSRPLFARTSGTVVFGQGLPNEVSYRPGTYTASIQAGPYLTVTTTFTIVA